MLRYRLNGFESLSLSQKLYIFCLAKATLMGRDITFDQQGKYNLRIRKTLEALYLYYKVREEAESDEFQKIVVYLKRVWFSSGIYHHYGCEKMKPDFSEEYFYQLIDGMDEKLLPLKRGETKEDLLDELVPVIFDDSVLPKRVNQTDGEDLVKTSACNFYENVTQAEVERFYAKMKEKGNEEAPSYGLNSKLTKRNGEMIELVWAENGMYGEAIREISSWLRKGSEVCRERTATSCHRPAAEILPYGRLGCFRSLQHSWVEQQEGMVDFVNGFIEVYGDPLALKGTREESLNTKTSRPQSEPRPSAAMPSGLKTIRLLTHASASLW